MAANIVEGGDVPSKCTIVGAGGREGAKLGAQGMNKTTKNATALGLKECSKNYASMND